MFKIKEEPFGKFKRIVLQNSNTKEQLGVIPEFGANINELILSKNSKQFSILLGANTDEELCNDKVYRSAQLFPFPNRIKDGEYKHKGEIHKLAKNEPDRSNALHGFVFHQKFTLLEKISSPDLGCVSFKYEYLGNISGYPFTFSLIYYYTLSEDGGFTCESRLTNTSDQIMPAGFGWHPYYQTGNTLDKMKLQLPECAIYDIDKQMIPTGSTHSFVEFEKSTIIGSRQFDDGFKITNGKNKAEIILEDPDQDLKICLWQETGPNKFNYFQIYTTPDRKSIAIEPMSCIADAFNSGDGLMSLAPQQSVHLKFGIYLI